jgi:hypothetical protein
MELIGRPEQLGFNIKAFHGTNKDFHTFEMGSKLGSGSREGPLGIWFTDNPEAASGFADFAARGQGASVMPVRLRLKHPWVIKSYNEIRDLVDRFTTFRKPDYVVGGRQIRMNGDTTDYPAARQFLQANGYDGIVLPDTLTDSPDGKTPITQYVVFNPSQIRSEFANYDQDKLDSGNISERYSCELPRP